MTRPMEPPKGLLERFVETAERFGSFWEARRYRRLVPTKLEALCDRCGNGYVQHVEKKLITCSGRCPRCGAKSLTVRMEGPPISVRRAILARLCVDLLFYAAFAGAVAYLDSTAPAKDRRLYIPERFAAVIERMNK